MQARSSKKALEAFAKPIEAHARLWAAGVLDSIEVDLKHDRKARFQLLLEEVSSREEWANARSDRPKVPEGAEPWACDVWRAAFGSELSKLVRERGEALKGSLDHEVMAMLSSAGAR
jgi:hypothetical protein